MRIGQGRRRIEGEAPDERITLALTASKVAMARVRRYKGIAQFAPPLGAVGHMPFPHRTVAEVDGQC